MLISLRKFNKRPTGNGALQIDKDEEHELEDTAGLQTYSGAGCSDNTFCYTCPYYYDVIFRRCDLHAYKILGFIRKSMLS